ncbi:MAG: hypothetical protein ACKVP0_10875 [Pirellulaceae bacterium]
MPALLLQAGFFQHANVCGAVVLLIILAAILATFLPTRRKYNEDLDNEQVARMNDVLPRDDEPTLPKT